MPAERSGEAVLTGMVKAASELVAERSYEGVSARDLQRFSQYQEVGSGIRLVKEDISLTQLYAGLAVLCREGYAHVQSLENSQHPALRDVVTDVTLEERRRYGHEAFPYDGQHF